MSVRYTLLIGLIACAAAAGAEPNLAFKADGSGAFAFDTGAYRGRLAAKEGAQGIVSLVDVKTGQELTGGHRDYGLFSFYRMLSTDHRWGTVAWTWPMEAKLLPDGAAQITWPARDDHPIEMTAVYRWQAPDTLDVHATVRPGKDAARFEMFVGSYFADRFRASAWLRPGLHGSGEPSFMPADASPLTIGTYLCFPRDRQAAQRVYDGRWEKGTNPVQWSITRFMAGPLVLQTERDKGTGIVLMSPPGDCFAVGMPYNLDPPDGVANHHSTYFSLFGQDLKAGQAATARLRAVVGRDITPEQALAAYRAFEKQR